MQNRKRDTDVQNRLLDSVGEGEGGMFQENSIETCILSRVKQITNPGWMHETSARAWCTGKTQRDWVEREVGGGSGWGIHVTPWLIHVNVWQKPLQYCKVISLQLIKINGKKRKKKKSFIFYLYDVCIEMNNFCILKLVSNGLIYALLILIMNNENYISPFLFLCLFCLFFVLLHWLGP